MPKIITPKLPIEIVADGSHGFAGRLMIYTHEGRSALIRALAHDVKTCKECTERYNNIVAETKKIKDKATRDLLLKLFETLRLNNSNDLDIIEGGLNG